MGYRAVFLDMDGTLLNRHGKITKATRDSIKRAQDQGVIIVVNSGRMPLEIERILRKYDLRLSYIALNGAYIKDALNNKVIYKKVMDEKVCIQISQLCNQLCSNSFWYERSQVYAKSLLKNFRLSKGSIKQIVYEAVMLASGRFIRIKDLNEVEKRGKWEVFKGAIMCANLAKMEVLREELQKQRNVEVFASSPVYLEFNALGTSKGNGMKRFLRYYGLSLEEAVAVGDQENDISMIQAAGLGIAMGNGVSKVKEVADAVTDTNNRDGVAKVLHKFLGI